MPFARTNGLKKALIYVGETVSNVKWYLVRRWLYWLVAAGIPLAIYVGVLDPEVAPLILPIVLAALNANPAAVPGEPDGE